MTSKRIFDTAITILALMLLFPVLMGLSLLVLALHGTPVIFRQMRPGQFGRPFMMYKFRTMTDQRNEYGELLPDGIRLTAFGRFLRSTSLDELPELLNVLKGDMSLVGPRPLLMEYLPKYSHEQARRHEIRPGITGWAQINGRNAISWDEKLDLDVWYVENRSFLLDIKILWRTFVAVFRREGISQDGHATMEKFTGANTASSDRRHER